MRNKTIAWTIAMVILIVISMQPVLAIGISPAREHIDYSPGLKMRIPITILNNEAKDIRVLVYAQGELAPYINLNQTLIPISGTESRKEFIIELELPMEMESAGNIQAQIFALEFPPEHEAGEDEKIISARAAVASQIIVRVPYPGKYAEAGFYIDAGNAGEPARFTIPMINLGTDPIVRARADIIIYSPTNEKIAELSTNEASIESKRQADLKASWPANANPGTYYAVAIVDYDGKKLRFEKTFRIGSMLLELLGIDVSSFKLGDIAEFNIKLYNSWNQMLEGIYAEMTVRDLKDRTYTTFKSSSKDIDALSTETLQTYWNTNGVSVGPYKLDLIVYYAKQTLEKSVDISVYPNEIMINPLTGMAIGQDNRLSRDSIIIMAILALLAINISWFVFFSKKFKRFAPKRPGEYDSSGINRLNNEVHGKEFLGGDENKGMFNEGKEQSSNYAAPTDNKRDNNEKQE